jgi:hypothetical protein
MVEDFVDDDEAEEELFEREMREAGIKVCEYRGGPCDGWAVNDKGVGYCSAWDRSGAGFACLRIRLKGGMTLYEKLKRQGLLSNDCNGGEKNE